MLNSLQPGYRAIVYALATITFWSTVATAFKLSLGHIGFLPLVFYSSLVSAGVLGLLCFYQGKLAQFRTWKRGDFLRSAGLGLLNPALYYLLLFRAYELLPAQEAQVLNFTWPIVLTLMGVAFLGQRIGFFSLLAIAVSFVGVAIIATRGELMSMRFSNLQGVSLALASTLVWAAYWIVNQTEKRDPLLRLLANFAAGTLWMALLMQFTGQWQLPGPEALVGAVYIGLFEMSLAFFCWFQALRLTINISLLNNMIFLTPFGSLLVISLVLKEPIYPSTLAGLVLIMISIFTQKMLSARRADTRLVRKHDGSNRPDEVD